MENRLSEICGLTGVPFTPVVASLNSPGYTTSEYTSGEGTLGALTWYAVTAPTGSMQKQYYWSKQGRVVYLCWRIIASIAGVSVTQVSTPLPADCPEPLDFTSQASDGVAYPGSGALLPGLTLSALGGGSGLYKEADGKYTLKILTGGASLAAKVALASLVYLSFHS